MPAGDLFQLFGGAGAGVVGVCLIFVILFITGQISTKKQLDDAELRYQQKADECEEWKEAWRLERARGDANEATGRIVKDVMLGLRQVGKELELDVAVQAQEEAHDCR
ncbi:MAG TPA: hypothetical protein VHE33_10480 [Acidobacteriaceae bacterium]|nr:hypothetical protein [Acidobacteriaceae bacterium]